MPVSTTIFPTLAFAERNRKNERRFQSVFHSEGNPSKWIGIQLSRWVTLFEWTSFNDVTLLRIGLNQTSRLFVFVPYWHKYADFHLSFVPCWYLLYFYNGMTFCFCLDQICFRAITLSGIVLSPSIYDVYQEVLINKMSNSYAFSRRNRPQ